MTEGAPKIPKDLREWYDSLIHRRNQCLKRGRLMQRAEFWMDYEDTFVSLIERIATAEARVAELETQLAALREDNARSYAEMKRGYEAQLAEAKAERETVDALIAARKVQP
jgi:hypothetical protein